MDSSALHLATSGKIASFVDKSETCHAHSYWKILEPHKTMVSLPVPLDTLLYHADQLDSYIALPWICAEKWNSEQYL